MSYDYEMYDGKRINVDGEIIGLLAMEFGREVEEVWKEYHAELAMTEEQERQSEAYKESLRRTLSAQYEKVATLEAENAKLREQIHWLKHGDILHVLTDQEYIDQCERERLMQVSIDALDKENAKLRELAMGMYGMLATVDAILGNHDACETPRPLIFGENKSFKDAMRELGVDE